MGEYDEKPLCVTLERDVTIPGEYHAPSATDVFRAERHSVADESITFFGLNLGSPNTVVEISKDNIRAIVTLGEYPDDHPYHDEKDDQ